MEQKIEHLVAKIKAIPNKLIAIEASWDGDDLGWGVALIAVIQQENAEFNDYYVDFIRYELDEYYNPPVSGSFQQRKESQTASLIGSRLAEIFNVPFYFPSPQEIKDLDKVPRWVDYQAGRLSSIPIGLIDYEEITNFFAQSTVMGIEAYWKNIRRFVPYLSIHVDIHNRNLIPIPKFSNTGILSLGNLNTEFVLITKKANKEYQVGYLDWDEADRGRIIHGKPIPNNAPVDEMVRIGNILANHFGVSFYFPSPEKPVHNLPRWRFRKKHES